MGYTHAQSNILKVTTMMNNDDESDNDEPSWGCLAHSSSLTRIYDVQLKTREDFPKITFF